MSIVKNIVEKLPDSIFIRLYNLKRVFEGNPSNCVHYEKIKDGVYLLHLKEFSIYCPSLRWVYANMKSFERKVELFYKIKPEDICVDVGSCIGDTTIPMAMKTGKNGKVFAIEPDKANLRFLRMNQKFYDGIIKIFPVAVAKQNGKQILHHHKEPTGHSLTPSKEPNYGDVEVECWSLNHLLDAVGGHIDFCKIDVQAYETELLSGNGNSRFFQNVDKLIVETHDRFDPLKCTFPTVMHQLYNADFNLNVDINTGVIHAKKK